ncbi:hypothetical protein DDJ76_22725 [Mycobacteroides abscessus]|nr:hypothetical protein DDJ76_22725 [Mycobacteroides abscessus]RIS11351.1 hypothetical protein D2E69_22465 [Mycobacteroides abscessus]RIS23544.1 hypothetical protein D2E67_21990 [Mycobacteroides abscessus]SLJ70804.1 Uncharacterised protein [Mycobacteroides abscessus subsp. abscessus]
MDLIGHFIACSFQRFEESGMVQTQLVVAHVALVLGACEPAAGLGDEPLSNVPNRISGMLGLISGLPGLVGAGMLGLR